MKHIIILLTLLCICMCGCQKGTDPMDQALSLRSAVLQSEKCTFSLEITADYGSMTYDFSMDCVADNKGNVTFVVTAPMTIAGITGRITEEGGCVTFDSTSLYIPMLTDDLITPVSAPWLLIRTIRGGCITSCSDGRLTIDDSFAEDALKLDIFLGQDNLPESVDIYWKNRRILALSVISFVIS